MSDNDIWIEVNEIKTELAQFYSHIFESRPIIGPNGPFSGTGISQFVCKFNLSAYVRHMIDAALEEKK